MINTLQEFLAAATQKASESLAAAVERIPEDKRTWSPQGQARTVLDMAAECALLNGKTAELIQSRKWPDNNYEGYLQEKSDAVAQGGDALQARLKENTERVAAVIRAVPDGDLSVEIAMPWGAQTLAEILAYPYWNMSYHEGQINYVASMLGCLD